MLQSPPRSLITTWLALVVVAIASSPALANYLGSIALDPGQRQEIYVGTTAQNMRVCNNFNSLGSVVATIAGNPGHDLSPGQCAEDIGDRLALENHSSGGATIMYRAILSRREGNFRFRTH